MTPKGYHEVRLPHDPRREVLWQALWHFRFSPLTAPEDWVLVPAIRDHT